MTLRWDLRLVTLLKLLHLDCNRPPLDYMFVKEASLIKTFFVRPDTGAQLNTISETPFC